MHFRPPPHLCPESPKVISCTQENKEPARRIIWNRGILRLDIFHVDDVGDGGEGRGTSPSAKSWAGLFEFDGFLH